MFQASRWKVLEVLILYWLGIFTFFFLCVCVLGVPNLMGWGGSNEQVERNELV